MTNVSVFRLTFVTLAALVALVACSSEPSTPPAGRPTCTAIYERCHPLDTGSGEIHECHEFAETSSTTEAQCQARRASCFTACTATDAGADAGGSDSGSSDVPTGG